ncbi:MAG: arginine--tRNA ligase [Candidatus Marinimicrobia bacterium]|nr:arginine--tRNA ligase [Candidatus Neomarinimicrobiota bacterium]
MRNKVLEKLQGTLVELNFPTDTVIIQNSKNPDHGDFSSNIAMILSGKLKQPPQKIADEIIQKLFELNSDNFFSNVEKAGPGFINFKLNKNLFHGKLLHVLKSDTEFGKSSIGKGKSANVEFVSANPTGPLTVGHGRGAMLGDTVANILEWNGYKVQREYYFNNAGRQMRVLGQSVYSRYLKTCGQDLKFDDEFYQGEYIKEIAELIFNEFGDSLMSDQNPDYFKDKAEKFIFEDIKSSLKKLGLEFDHFYNEQELYNSGKIQHILDELDSNGLIYQKDDATWFKGTQIGRDVDKVLVKKTGEPTYRLPDMAYHKTKFERGFDLCIDVFGADHIDTYPDVLAVIDQLGYDSNKVKVLIHQFVTIMKNGEQVKMSTRKANFVTLDELIDEVGADVVRYFFIMRGMSTHLNFDLDIAKDQSDNNPVFYLQYAHARMCNIINRAKGFGHTINLKADLGLLKEDEEQQLINQLLKLPELIEKCSIQLEPQLIVNFLHEFASKFHKYYAHFKVITDDKKLTDARLILIKAIQIAMRNGLTLIGINAPERM